MSDQSPITKNQHPKCHKCNKVFAQPYDLKRHSKRKTPCTKPRAPSTTTLLQAEIKDINKLFQYQQEQIFLQQLQINELQKLIQNYISQLNDMIRIDNVINNANFDFEYPE